MDLSPLNRLEPPCMQYASIGPKNYCPSSLIKPLIMRSDLKSSTKSPPPKLKIIALENEATKSAGRAKQEQQHQVSTANSDKISTDSSSKTKVNGRMSTKASMINGSNGGINGKISSKSSMINGKGGGAEQGGGGGGGEKGMRKGEEARRIVQKGSSCSVSEEEMKVVEGWASSILQASEHADIGNYMKFMQGLYLHPPPPPPSINEGLGIVDFLQGKNIFITGATGFLAKVLVEKILRVQPNVGQLFLLVKAKDMDHAKERMKEEIMHSHLFKDLKSYHGDSYQDFVERKIVPVVGNIATDGLGMDMDTMDAIQSKVDIIVNSAASTTFDERYDHALNLNTKGAQRIVEFGKGCPRLQLLMHVSTAFVNGERKGVVREKAFKIGYSIANEALKEKEDMIQDIDVDMESSIIQTKMDEVLMNEGQSNGRFPISHLNDQLKEKQVYQVMKDLGMERAKSFGWQDTYVFTKAMGEMLVDSTRGHLPIVIIRPSVVESSFKDPFPGWMEGNRMMDPIIISYGKGQLPGFLVNPRSVLDVVPVDMVANAMLAAMTRHASKPGLEVYQVASSVVNPLVFAELARMSQEHFLEHPFIDSTGKTLPPPTLQLFQDMDSFMHAVSSCSQTIKEKLPSTSNAKSLLKRHNQLSLKVKEQAAYLANLYRPYTFYDGRFDTSKTQQLFASLSCQEKELFEFDVSKIDWDTYIKRIHIPGLRKHVLKGRGSSYM